MERESIPIVVVGIGCRFPGAENHREFERVLAEGENHLKEVPPYKWNLDTFYDETNTDRGKSYVRKTAFLKGDYEFDNRLFDVSPSEAKNLDPQQSVLLEVVYHALENAGITRKEIKGTKTGVFIGAMSDDFNTMQDATEINSTTATGTAASNIAARISYVFDLRGNAVVVNTACSSSLEAIHLGCQALRTGDVDMAICGGVNIILSPMVNVFLGKAGMASRKGQCHAFSDNADGYARGEGYGIIILKRRHDATDDRIWAEICTGVNQDGHAVEPMTAPSPEQQKALYTEVFQKHHVNPADVQVIEAHGTGTKAGDPVEAKSVGEFFRQHPSPHPRYIGSVKTNVGHTESAAGVAGVIKVLLMMRSGQIYPSLFSQPLNSELKLTENNLIVPNHTDKWMSEQKVAMVNSFSFRGTNAMAILISVAKETNATNIICEDCSETKEKRKENEENEKEKGKVNDRDDKEKADDEMEKETEKNEKEEEEEEEEKMEEEEEENKEEEEQKEEEERKEEEKRRKEKGKGGRTKIKIRGREREQEAQGGTKKKLRRKVNGKKFFVLPFSAQTQKSVEESVSQFCRDQKVALCSLSDLSYTACMKRGICPCRIAATGRTKEELIANLEKKLEPTHSHDSARPVKLIFVFCGMGTSWKGMGQEFLEIQVFCDKISEIDAELKAYVPWSLKQRLTEGHDVADPVYGPIATFAFQVAQFATWKRWGLQPQAIVGQSVGEVAAACCAGMLSTKEAVKLIYFRTTAIASARQGGRMMAVTNCDVQDVRSLCEEKTGQICVALEYSPTACAVSGDQDAVEEIQGKLRESFPESSCNILPVRCAYHSHHMTSGREKFLQELESLDATALTEGVEIASTVRGDLAKDDDFMSPDYWARSIQDPNLFFQGLKVLLDPSKLNLIVEIGPKPILRAHLKEYEKLECDILRFSSSMQDNETQCMMQTLTEMFEHGLNPRWHEVMLFPTSALTDHPIYHFDRKKLFARPARARRECCGMLLKAGDHRLLRKITGGPDNKFKMVLESGSMDSVFQHRVHGVIILPGAVYLELGLAAAWLKDVTSLYRTTVNMKFLEPVKLDPKVNLELDVIMTPRESTEESRFRIEVLQGEVTHAIGEIKIDKHQGRAQKFDLSAVMKRCKSKISSDENRKTLEDSGFIYGPDWWMQGETFHNDEEAIVELLPGERIREEEHGILAHPAILDASFQVTTPLFESGLQQNLIPTGVEGCRLFRPIQESRYAYARKVVQSDNHWSFSLLLLSESGDVVLEVTSFRVQAIGQAGTSQFLANLLWRKLDDCKIPEEPNLDAKHVVMIGDFWETRKETNVFPLNPEIDENRQLERAIEFCKKDGNISAVFFYAPNATDTNFEGRTLQTMTQETCMTLKNILLKLANEKIDLPLIVVTRFAWPSPEELNNYPESGSGICNAPLWGLVRTALRESNVHSPVQLVELQTEEGDIDGLNILSTVLHNSRLVDFPEILLTNKSVYVQDIRHVHENHPLYRNHAFDASCRAVAYFDDLSHTKILLRYDTSTQSSAEQKSNRLHVQTVMAARFTNDFFSQSSFNEASEVSSNSEVIGTEFKGIFPSASNEVVCIVPHAVTTHLEVPESRTLPLRLIPHYRPGFAMRLTLLQWMKQSARGNRHILIAANEESESFARLLKDMLYSVPETRTLEILLVNKEQTKDLENQSFDCVISMAKLTKELALDLIRLGIQPKILIAVETLITEGAIAASISHIPDLRIVRANSGCLYTQRLFEMKRWMEENNAAVERTCASWKRGNEECPSCPQDVSALFAAEIIFSMENEASNPKVRAFDPKLFRPDASYIVVGGLTGLGWECVQFLAKHGAGIIVIFNRRPASSERKEQMKNLAEQCECQISSKEVDVTIKAHCDQMLQEVKRDFGIIKGVYFGAALVHDEIIQHMKEENVRKVMTPKIVGAWNLHELTKDQRLDYFVLHSSVASTLGNAGQGSYSAANCFLDP